MCTHALFLSNMIVPPNSHLWKIRFCPVAVLSRHCTVNPPLSTHTHTHTHTQSVTAKCAMPPLYGGWACSFHGDTELQHGALKASCIISWCVDTFCISFNLCESEAFSAQSTRKKVMTVCSAVSWTLGYVMAEVGGVKFTLLPILDTFLSLDYEMMNDQKLFSGCCFF